jgi:hypothetical protein
LCSLFSLSLPLKHQLSFYGSLWSSLAPLRS